MEKILLNTSHVIQPKFDFNWKEQSSLHGIALKDSSAYAAMRAYPALTPLVEHLLSLLPKKRFMLLDCFHIDFSKQSLTCSNEAFHLDGRMKVDDLEEYAIWASGENRTVFMSEPIEVALEDVVPLGISPKRFRYFNELLGDKICDDQEGFEIPDSCPIVYNLDFHKGRRATKPEGERFFCRVMASNYLRPGYQKRRFKD